MLAFVIKKLLKIGDYTHTALYINKASYYTHWQTSK